jgi:oligoendopeptidase F
MKRSIRCSVVTEAKDLEIQTQFKENKQQALENYTKALSLGGTCTLPELYEAAGLPFDFSPERIKVLMDMVRDELQKLD